MEECMCKKHKLRSDEDKKKLINRLSRIEGQVRGLKNMVESDSYCIDILNQASAVVSALESFERSLLEDHIRGCVSDGIKRGEDEYIEELILTLSKMI